MKELFKDLPEAIENTILIARKCHFMPQMAKPMLPSFMPQNFLTHKTHKTHNTGGNPLKGKKPSEKQASQALSVASVAQSENEEFENQAKQGLSERLRHLKATIGIAEEYTEKDYQDRLEFEIKIINKMNYAGYFLIVSDFIKYAKQQNIPVGPGRGSGAGSLVAYSLKITDLDPIRYGLIFERFLNPDRVSMPDFDIDFCQEKRDEVISYVQQKYGKETVAQIITFGKLQARAVLRDVGRVLQMPYGKVDRISKMVPFNPVAPVTLAEAIKMDDNLRQQQKEDEEIANLLNIGLKLEGLHRHISTHAAGIVIAPGDLKKYIPIYKDP
jgi:DNA polymerase-3 subunit alpha